jgi:transcription elongation factor GreA
MAKKGSYITPEGYEKAREELMFLKGVRRKELSKEIGIARAHGDLRENAEYKAAKEAQALNEKRIAELEEKLAGSQILDDSKIPKNEALIGATLKLKDMDSGEEFEYTLVGELEADFSQGKISITSPIGKGLLGHKKKQVVKIKVPAGILRYKILDITR